ncbi:MAG: chromosomal replication initiator protein DnaA [Phototrophicales bacterium]|nr:MAG: chromosomal replication initiator protein DnaA [Phototrophicales bacterium]
MDGQKTWDLACQQLQVHLDKNSYDTWIRGSFFIELDAENRFVIGVRNEFVRQMLQVRLYRQLRRVLDDVTRGQYNELRFEVRQKPPEAVKSEEEEMPLFRLPRRQVEIVETPRPPLPLHELIATPKNQDVEGIPVNPKMTFKRFIPSENNRMTYEAATAVAECPGHNYNPFMVYGGVGLGKSHILQAIGNECLKAGLNVIYVTAEIFTNDLVHAIRTNTTQRFRQRYREADVLLMDDMQFIIGKDATQEELFHTFEELHRFNKQIVFASDRHPRDFPDVADRLKSRFQAGLVTDVQPLTYEARLAIVEMWTLEHNITIDRKVQEMIAKKAYRHVRELEGMFNQVMAKTRFNKSPLSVSTAAETLDQYDRPRDHLQKGKVTSADILRATADYFKLTVEDITGSSRVSKINFARQIAIYLLREQTDYSLNQIGALFNRTHSTILHSYNKVIQDLNELPDLKHQIARIKESLF